MNDITKARYFLKTKGSDLQHLESFGLMLTTAENRYREIRLLTSSNRVETGLLDSKEVEAAVDWAVLRYLKKHNRLPQDLPKIFQQGIDLKEKRQLASQWINA